MATTVDTLAVRIEADLTPMRRALRNAQNSVKNSTQKMAKGFQTLDAKVAAVTARLGGLKGAALAGAAAGVAMLGAGAVRTSARFEDLQKTLNVVFGGMEQGEAAMRFIKQFAQTTPFDVETLTNAFIKFKAAGIDPTVDLMNTFGDAASVTTDKVAAFETMVRVVSRSVSGGLEMMELDQLADQGLPVFEIIEQKLGILRKEVTEFGQTAEGAEKIIEALKDGFDERFGGAMAASLKNTSTEMSNLNIAATDAMQALGDGIGGFGLSAATGFLSDTLAQLLMILKPVARALSAVLGAALYAVTGILRGFTEATLLLMKGLVDLVEFGAKLVPEKFAGFHSVIDDMVMSLEELEERMNSTTDTASDAIDTSGLKKDSKELTDTLEKQAEALKTFQAEAAGYSDAQIEALKSAGLFSKMDFTSGITGTPLELVPDVTRVLDAVNQVEILRQAKEALEEEEEEREKKAEERAKSLEQRQAKAAAAFEKVKDAVMSTLPPQTALLANIKMIEDALPSMGEKLRGLAEQGLAKLRKEAQETAFQFERDMNPAFDALVSGAQALGDGVVSSFRGMLDGTKDVLGGFKDMLKNVVADVIAQIFRLTVVNQVLNAIFPGLGLQTSTMGGILGTAAGGGAIQGGKPYLVGERGPELIVPKTGSTVMNNHNTKNALGGGGGTVVHQTINVSAGVSQTVRAEMLSLLPRFKQDTMNAVVDAKRRGGSFGQAFG